MNDNVVQIREGVQPFTPLRLSDLARTEEPTGLICEGGRDLSRCDAPYCQHARRAEEKREIVNPFDMDLPAPDPVTDAMLALLDAVKAVGEIPAKELARFPGIEQQIPGQGRVLHGPMTILTLAGRKLSRKATDVQNVIAQESRRKPIAYPILSF